MVIFDNLKIRVESLLTTPGQELGRWARFARFQIQLWRFCMRRLRQHNAMAMSAALSFRTIFTLIPTLVLAVMVMKPFGLLEDSKASLRNFLDTVGISQIKLVQDTQIPLEESEITGAQKSVLQTSATEEIMKLVEAVENQLTFGLVGPVGIALLIWTALTLLTTIERSLNRIYEARASRGVFRRLMLYWSVITLLPVLLTAAFYGFNKVSQAFAHTPVLFYVVRGFNWGGSVIVGMLLLAVVYKLMPNTSVGYRAAFGGAMIALPLWLIVKWAFGLYVIEVAKTSLYGVLGLLPLFLMWLNFSWLIFLFGAELSYTAAGLSRMQSEEQAEKIVLGPSELLAAAVAVASDYNKGAGPVRFAQIAARLNLPDVSVQRLMERLQLKEVICPVESETDNAYVLTRPAEKIGVLEIMDIGGAQTASVSSNPFEEHIADKISRVNQQARSALGDMTLNDIISER